MHALFSGLALALLSGLTVFAFNHPHAYARLYPYLIAGTSVVLALFACWQGAIEAAWTSLEPLIANDMTENATRAKETLSVPLLTVVLGYFGLMGFLWGNRKLPGFVHDIEKKREETRSARDKK